MKLSAFLLLAVVSAAGALDFRPTVVEGRGEGGKYSYLQFRDNGNNVSYMPPRTWGFRGRESTLCLTVPGTTGVEIDIGVLPLKDPRLEEPRNLRAFEEFSRQLLPGEAAKVEFVAVEFNPLVIDGRNTVEVTFSYLIFGGPIKVSFLYAVRDKDLLCFRVVAKPEEFDRLHQTFRTSLHSFAGL